MKTGDIESNLYITSNIILRMNTPGNPLYNDYIELSIAIRKNLLSCAYNKRNFD